MQHLRIQGLLRSSQNPRGGPGWQWAAKARGSTAGCWSSRRKSTIPSTGEHGRARLQVHLAACYCGLLPQLWLLAKTSWLPKFAIYTLYIHYMAYLYYRDYLIYLYLSLMASQYTKFKPSKRSSWPCRNAKQTNAKCFLKMSRSKACASYVPSEKSMLGGLLRVYSDNCFAAQRSALTHSKNLSLFQGSPPQCSSLGQVQHHGTSAPPAQW